MGTYANTSHASPNRHGQLLVFVRLPNIGIGPVRRSPLLYSRLIAIHALEESADDGIAGVMNLYLFGPYYNSSMDVMPDGPTGLKPAAGYVEEGNITDAALKYVGV